MAPIKKIFIAVILILCLFAASSCSVGKALNSDGAAAGQSIFAWSIILKGFQVTDGLSTTKTEAQYNGETKKIPYQEKPGTGKLFLLVNLVIEKQKTGNSRFEWANLYIKDSSGNKFYRHPNDTFLETFNFKRIKSTDLAFGKNEGFICFEIPEKASNEKLFLVYESAEGKNSIKLK